MTARRVLSVSAALLLCTGLARGEWVLEHFAGGGPDDLPAVEANVARPTSVAVDASGDLFILASELGHVLRLDGAGRIHMYLDSSGNDVLAGVLREPTDLFIDAQGALRVVDGGGIGSVDPDTGEYVLQGVGRLPVRQAAMDSQGAIFFTVVTYMSNPKEAVYRWDPLTDETTIVAGMDCSGWPPPWDCWLPQQDDVLATETWLGSLSGLALGPGGDLFILEGHRIRRVDAATGIISTVAGSSTSGFSGDGGPATEATLYYPSDLEFDGAGNFYIADQGNDRIRCVDAVTGIIDTVAGNGDSGFSGDGGPATAAALDGPVAVTLDGAGNLLVADSWNERVRRVLASTGIIETIAGNGTLYYSGDGNFATGASIAGSPTAIDAEGNLFISEPANHRVRKVDAASGLVATFAGNGDSTPDVEDEGLPADQAVIITPGSIVFDSAGNMFLSDGEGNLRRIDGASGLIETVDGMSGGNLAIDAQDRLYVGRFHYGVDRFDPVTGETIHVAGGSTWPANAEGVPAVDADLWVGDIEVGPAGDLFLTEGQMRSVRWVDHSSGLIYTAVGGGFGSASDYYHYPQPAIGAAIFTSSISLDLEGALFVVDMFGDMLGRVDPATGVMHKIVGAGRLPWGEPLPEGSVRVYPGSPLADSQGNVYISSGNRILLARNVNRPPLADAGGHLDLDCSSASGRSVQLDGSASYDPDDLPGGQPEVQFYWWYEDFGLPTERLIDKGETVETELPIGGHEITLRVGDRWGAWGTDTIAVTVADPQDEDSDGVGSCADNCPDLFNPDQIDIDGNGLGDDCDPCLATPFDDPDGDGVCSDADNCPGLSNPLQLDRDADEVGDACDVCPESSNTGQEESGSCLVAAAGTGECLPIRIDPAEGGRSGRALLTEIFKFPPDSISFMVRYQTCETGDEFEFLLNGHPLSAAAPAWRTYYCGSPCMALLRIYNFTSATTIAAAWDLAGPNELRFVKRGSLSEVQWVRARISSGDSGFDVCILDQEGGQCDTEPDCEAGVTDGDIDAAATTDLVLRGQREVRELPYGPEPLSQSLDVASWPDGEYRICLTATDPDDPGRLYATTGWGDLAAIDFLTGASTMAGTLPVRPLDMACNPVTKRGVASTSRSFVHAFDIRDGAKLGGIVPTQHSYFVLEQTGSTLYAVYPVIYGDYPYQDIRSYFYSLDAETGEAQYVGRIEDAWIVGLAHDDSGDRLFAQYAANAYDSQPSGGWTGEIDPSTEEIISATPLSVELGGLSFGPDGLLYGITLGWQDPGVLHRIDLASETATPIGETGFDDVIGLTLAGSPGTVDCIEFAKQGQTLLALNDSCGPPTAVAQAPEQAECTSPTGAAVLLDGSGSSDPNSLAGTNDGIVSYDWFEAYGQAEEIYLGAGPILLVDLPLGYHEITLNVTNRFGESDRDSVAVVVADSVPPELSVSLDPAVLWPPNHLMVGITASVEAADLCGEPEVALVSITSNEPDDAIGVGDGSTLNDIQGADYGVLDLAFELRAERSGSGSGRIYDVVYSATDGAGNRTDTTGMVVVPHLRDGIEKRWRWHVHNGKAAGVAVELAPLAVLPDPSPDPVGDSDSSSVGPRSRGRVVRCLEVESSEGRSPRTKKERETDSRPLLRCWVE